VHNWLHVVNPVLVLIFHWSLLFEIKFELGFRNSHPFAENVENITLLQFTLVIAEYAFHHLIIFPKGLTAHKEMFCKILDSIQSSLTVQKRILEIRDSNFLCLTVDFIGRPLLFELLTSPVLKYFS